MSNTYRHKVSGKKTRGKEVAELPRRRPKGRSHIKGCQCRVCLVGLHNYSRYSTEVSTIWHHLRVEEREQLDILLGKFKDIEDILEPTLEAGQLGYTD